MTNHFHAKAVFEHGVWRAMVRYVHKASYWPVMDGDRPASFETREAAEIAALREQERHINGTLRRDGERLQARNAAEALFGRAGR